MRHPFLVTLALLSSVALAKEDSAAPDAQDTKLRDQYGVELQYRLFVTNTFSVIPGLHVLFDP